MPIIKSAKKRVRVSARKAAVNQLHRSGSKTAVRSATRAIAAQTQEAAMLSYQAASRLDRAVAKGAIHQNKAARLKRRLTSRLKAAGMKPFIESEPKATPTKTTAKSATKKSTTKTTAKKATTKEKKATAKA